MTKKTKLERIGKYLTTRKTPATVAEISRKFQIKPDSVSKRIYDLKTQYNMNIVREGNGYRV